MAESVTELIVESYYRFQKYLVSRGLAIKNDNNNRWGDLDILAVKDDVLFINCKDYLPSSEQKIGIINNFKTDEIYIGKHFPDLSKKGKPRLLYIYGGGTSNKTIEYLTDPSKNGGLSIECKHISVILKEYIAIIKDTLAEINHDDQKILPEKGYSIVGSYSGLEKVFLYLYNNHYINIDR